jgi:hypothetical protein
VSRRADRRGSLYNSAMRRALIVLPGLLLALACGRAPERAAPAAGAESAAPSDPQHQGLTEPHGDHSAHHGGMVFMNGDVHYELVLSAEGKHRVWFSDPMRNDLPASIVKGITLTVTRPDAPAEVLRMAIDESGESWVAAGRPVSGEGVMVKVEYALEGAPHEVEVPFVAATTP